jgi:hypothetical protein
MSKSNKRRNDRGGAFLEFALVFPLCILFAFGIFELGRLFAQYSWVQQTTYNAAFLGSGYTLTSNQTDPVAVATKLYDLQNSASRNPMTLQPSITKINRGDGSIQIGISGQLRMLLPGNPLGLNVSSTSPELMIPYSAGDPNIFENADNFYNCDGSACGSSLCSPNSC